MNVDQRRRPCAIVTGAGSERGIGNATARALAASGWDLALLDINEAGARQNAEEISRRYEAQAVPFGLDVSNEDMVRSTVESIAQHFPSVKALINNAGITAPTAFVDTTTEEWDRVFAVNSRGTFLMTKFALPLMLEHDFGRIVNVSSMAAQRGGGFGRTAYSASKAAMIGFSNALAREVAEFGITVNAIAPGYIVSDLPDGALGPEQEAQIVSTIPVGRPGTPTDVANLVAYLCRVDTGFVTGSVYDINGGAHIH